MNYQWYPGHMTKAKRAMEEDIRLIDLIIELVDARMPLGSRNPDIDSLGRQKARLVLLNKADLADPAVNREWIRWFGSRNVKALEINAQTGQGMKRIQGAVQEVCREKTERDRKRGIKNRPVRAMVAGIPNVGKSTFINSFAGKACTKTGNRPGVTKGKQWIRLNRELELLDTPGILWPKFEDQQAGMHLAFIGSMNDEIIVMEEMALDLIRFLQGAYPDCLRERYGCEETFTPVQVLETAAQKRGCLKKGGEADLTRAAGLIVEDFRAGRLGRISLEQPEEDRRQEEAQGQAAEVPKQAAEAPKQAAEVPKQAAEDQKQTEEGETE